MAMDWTKPITISDAHGKVRYLGERKTTGKYNHVVLILFNESSDEVVYVADEDGGLFGVDRTNWRVVNVPPPNIEDLQAAYAAGAKIRWRVKDSAWCPVPTQPSWDPNLQWDLDTDADVSYVPDDGRRWLARCQAAGAKLEWRDIDNEWICGHCEFSKLADCYRLAVPKPFQADRTGWYRKRDGGSSWVAMVVPVGITEDYPVLGYERSGERKAWTREGLLTIGSVRDGDLVEYLGGSLGPWRRC